MPSKTDPKRLEYLAKYRNANRERLQEYQRNWSANNRDKERAKAARYLAKHKDWNAQKSQLRRARLKDAETFVISNKDLRRLYNQPCANCGTMEQLTIDHIIAISRGGRHSIGNLQTLCLNCNSKKHTRTIMEWRMNKRITR